MNPVENLSPAEDGVVSKKLYEKPALTTFGSVASLTLSGGKNCQGDGRSTFAGTFHASIGKHGTCE